MKGREEDLRMEEFLMEPEIINSQINNFSNKCDLNANWFDPNEEEEQDVESVKITLSKYHEFFQLLYSRYATSKNPKISKTIKIADVWRMLKTYNIPSKILSPSEVAIIFKTICLNIGKNDALGISLELFQELFLQLSVFAYRNADFCLKFGSPSEKIDLFINQFKIIAKSSNDSELLISLNLKKQRYDKVPKELEAYIKQNPFYPLPEGFKKIEEKVLISNYTIPSYLIFKPALKYSIEILDDILLENFGFHLLESITTYDYIPKIVPKMMASKANSPEPAKHFMRPLEKQQLLPPKRSVNNKSCFADMNEHEKSAKKKLLKKSEELGLLDESIRRKLDKKATSIGGLGKSIIQINALISQEKKKILEERLKTREQKLKYEFEQK